MRPLDGLTVVDLSDHPSGQACAQVLAQGGARSILVESPSGARTRTWTSDPSPHEGDSTFLFQHLNHGKLSVVLDPADPASVAVCADLVRAADVVITSSGGYAPPVALSPHTVHCAVSDFPEGTELAGWRGSEMIHQALSGTMYATGDDGRRPLFGVGQRAYWTGGFTAAISVLSALVERHRSGLGQHVVTSVFEACAAIGQNLVTQYSYNGTWQSRRAYPGMLSLIRCRDAWVILFAFGNWPGLCKAFGVSELATDPRFTAADDRLRSWSLITELLQAGAATLAADDVVDEAQRHKVCAEKVASIGDVIGSAYFQKGRFPGVVAAAPAAGEAGDLGLGPWLTFDSCEQAVDPLERGVPRLGEHTAELERTVGELPPQPAQHDDSRARTDTTAKSIGPLAGVRIVDLTTAWAGPMATRSLAYLGAEVVKIEAPSHPDAWRASLGALQRFPDLMPGAKPFNRSALFNTQNHDKLSVGLDLKHPRGLEVARELVARADIVMSNFSPGVMDRLGLGHTALLAVNERVVDVEMPAFRSDSDMASHVGMGKTMEAASGMVGLMAYSPDGHPVPTGPAHLDPIGGLHGATAALLGLLRAVRFGQGSHLEVAQTDAATRWIGEYVLEHLETGSSPAPRGNVVRGMAPHDSFPCRGEDEWIAVAVDGDDAWERLAALSGLAGLSRPELRTLNGRAADREHVYDEIAAWTILQDKHDLARSLQAHGIMAAPVNNGKDVHGDPALRSRGFLVELQHPEAGTHLYPSLAFTLDRTPGAVLRPAPTFGQHNDVVLGSVLGMTPEQIDELRRQHVLHDDPLVGELA